MGRIDIKNRKEDDFINPREEIKESPFINLRGFIDGSLLSHDMVFKQLPFLFFLTVLGLFYIGLHYENQKTYKKMVKVKKEVSELRFKHIEYGINLMKMNRLSEIEQRVKNSGLDIRPLSGQVTKIKIEKK